MDLRKWMSVSLAAGVLVCLGYCLLTPAFDSGAPRTPQPGASRSTDANGDPVAAAVPHSGAIQESMPNSDGALDQELTELIDGAVPSAVVEFVTREPDAYSHYSRLLNQARESPGEDTVADFLDYGVAFLEEAKLGETSRKDMEFIQGLCKQIRGDLAAFRSSVSSEFFQLSEFKILLAEYSLPRDRSHLVDHGAARGQFERLAELRCEDPVRERQRRYLLFMAQAQGMHRWWNQNGMYTSSEYYNYAILKEVAKLSPVGSEASGRAKKTAAKIDMAAQLEYARADFISSSRTPQNAPAVPQDEKTIAQYDLTLSRYTEALALLDKLAVDFAGDWSEVDKREVAVLRKRAMRDQCRTPWSYAR